MKRKPVRIVAWTPFVRCNTWSTPDGEMPIPDSIVVMRNSIYTVQIDECVSAWGEITWLSIKRNDRLPIHDWREFQRIKNELCSPTREAFEIYPNESRLVDSSNQYHLWVLPEGAEIPVGYAERCVVDHTKASFGPGRNAVQRPFAAGTRPDDAMTGEEVARRYDANRSYGTRLLHRRKA